MTFLLVGLAISQVWAVETTKSAGAGSKPAAAMAVFQAPAKTAEAAAPAKAPAAKTEPSQPAQPIKAIELADLTFKPASEIISAAQIISQVGDLAIQEKIDSDAKSIYALGYFQEVTGSAIPADGGVKVIFQVKENPVIKAILFQGNSVYADQQLFAAMQTKIGQILNYNDLQQDLKNIEDTMYHQAGYTVARVVDIQTDLVKGTLTIKIIEGVVEKIDLDGNDVTKDYVILRELKTRVGQPLNTDVLRKDLQKVFNLGYFKNVTPDIIQGEDPGKIVLVIKVEEQKTSSFNVGGGYGQREGWFGFADLNLDNLFGTAQSVLLRGQFGQNLSNYQFRYIQPWLLPDQTSFTFRRWYTVGKDVFVSQQNEKRNGWDIALGKPLTDVLRGTVTFKNESVQPETDPYYLVRSLEFDLSYDTRDVWMNPTEGSLYTASYEVAGGLMACTVDYRKYGLDLNQFFKLADKQVLAFHLGGNLGQGDIRQEEKYWLGSANTVRGYDNTVTGVKRILFNVEYRYSFNDMFQAVLFFDAGKIWDYSPAYLDVKRAGKGFGFRLNTPLGPIRLDYGIADYKNFGDGVFHFSIGQTF